MSGNRAIYDEALAESGTAVQRGAWSEALNAATRAAQEFPQDLDARSAVAIALYHTKQYTQSIQMLDELRKRRPGDAVTLAYLARALEGAGAPERAMQVLLELGGHHAESEQFDDAREAFEEAVRLQPQSEEARVRLAEMLVELNQPAQAADQCVEIARRRQQAGDIPGAQEALDEALGLDPENRGAQLLGAVFKAAIEPPPQPKAEPRPVTTDSLNAARRIDHLVGQAGLAYANGNGDAALQLYREALDLGADRADVFYNLGVLLQERKEHEQAVDYLRRAATSADFAVAAYYTLGEALRSLGRTNEAASAFEDALSRVDLETIGRGDVDDLIAMYEAAAEAYTAIENLSRAASLYGTLADVFHRKRWGKELGDQFKDRARDLTSRSMSVKLRNIGTGPLPPPRPVASGSSATQTWGAVPSLTGFLRGESSAEGAVRADESSTDPFGTFELQMLAEQTVAPLTPLPLDGCSELVVRYLQAAERFAEQGMLQAAMDACLEVVRIESTYFPVHLRMGELYEREGHREEAVLKYKTLIDTYTAFERPVDAIDAYYRLLDLVPDALASRDLLAHLLRQASRVPEAVTQALLVAAAYLKAGQTKRSIEDFRELLLWAPPTAAVHIEYGLALLKSERWDAALEEFGRAVRCDPVNPLAYAHVNLTMAMLGRVTPALWGSLQSLLDLLTEQPEHGIAVQGAYRSALMMTDIPLLHYLLGLVQQATGQHGSAILTFQQALMLLDGEATKSMDPVLLHQALATSYLAQQQPEAAIEALEAAASLSADGMPLSPSPFPFARRATATELQSQIAAAHLAGGDLAAASQSLIRAIDLDPSALSLYRQLADLYFRQGKLQPALDKLDWLATRYEEQGQLDQALSTLELAVQIAPNTIAVRARLARLLLRRGLIERGLTELNEAAQLQLNAGMKQAAVALLQQAGEVYWMLGQHADARQAYEKIVATLPDDLDALHQLVTIDLLLGNVEAALKTQRQIADISLRSGDTAAAIPALHQVLGLDRNDATAARQLAELDALDAVAVEES